MEVMERGFVSLNVVLCMLGATRDMKTVFNLVILQLNTSGEVSCSPFIMPLKGGRRKLSVLYRPSRQIVFEEETYHTAPLKMRTKFTDTFFAFIPQHPAPTSTRCG